MLQDYRDIHANGKISYTFKCRECEFDSLDYAISMTEKSTFNHVHRWLMKEWPWIHHITEKFFRLGFDGAIECVGELQKENKSI